MGVWVWACVRGCAGVCGCVVCGSGGMGVVGWLGRATHTLHCTHLMPHVGSRDTLVSFLFVLVSFRALSLTQRDGLWVGRLVCGMACWCFTLDACLVVVVAGSGDVLRTGSFPCARHVEERCFQRHRPLRFTLVDPQACPFPPSRVSCLTEARTGSATPDS